MEYKLNDSRFRAHLYLRGQDRLAVKIEYPDAYHERVKQFLRELTSPPQSTVSAADSMSDNLETLLVAA